MGAVAFVVYADAYTTQAPLICALVSTNHPPKTLSLMLRFPSARPRCHSIPPLLRQADGSGWLGVGGRRGVVIWLTILVQKDC